MCLYLSMERICVYNISVNIATCTKLVYLHDSLRQPDYPKTPCNAKIWNFKWSNEEDEIRVTEFTGWINHPQTSHTDVLWNIILSFCTQIVPISHWTCAYLLGSDNTFRETNWINSRWLSEIFTIEKCINFPGARCQRSVGENSTISIRTGTRTVWHGDVGKAVMSTEI